uniref:G domain-containing protein n=1 Tax=Electrophorus electricus TaxID=8005 RepID=A0AAY5F2Q3_ELEEL
MSEISKAINCFTRKWSVLFPSVYILCGISVSDRPDEMVKFLEDFKVCTQEVTELRFLLHGPVGAGKSSTFNIIKNVFEGRQFVKCLASSENSSGTSPSLHVKLPFAFYDVMGLEKEQRRGCTLMTSSNKCYVSKPSLNDQIHCLVSVIPADKIGIMDGEVIRKLKIIRDQARIPQKLFMTKVDKACIRTKKDLTMIYQSKKIKEKMTECSDLLGIPINCIFPVKNYHEETEMNEMINSLMLSALIHTVHSANDYVKRSASRLLSF